MSDPASASGRSLRSLAVVLALAIAISAGLALATAPRARAAFGSLSVEPGQYTGNPFLYVPTETLTITIEADAGDIYDVQVIHWPWPYNPAERVVYRTFDNQTVLAGGVKTLAWEITANLPDDDWYWVTVHDQDWYESGNSGTTFARYPSGVFATGFRIQGYTFDVWTDKDDYLPGDSVTASWLARNLKDGAPAPDGVGEMQVYDDSGAAVATPNPYYFNASQGSRTFRLSTSLAPDQNVNVFAWFNDTSGSTPARMGYDTAHPYVGYLGLRASTDRAVYAPGGLVTVSISAKITPNPGSPSSFDTGAAGAVVNVTVRDLATGNAVPAYGATGLRTDALGDLAHVFALALTPTLATYEVEVHAETNGVQTADRTISFDVEQVPTLDVSLGLSRSDYASGDSARATATVYREPAGTYTYRWLVSDASTGDVFASLAGGGATYDYAIPLAYEGTLRFDVTVDDGEGNEETAIAFADVAFGYLALTLNRPDYEAGTTLVVSYSLRSAVLTSPTYYYEITDSMGNVVAAGTASGGSLSYVVPDPARSAYTFTVTATQDGRSVEGQITVVQASGFALATTPDRETYLPGETVRIRYALTAKGTTALPPQFWFYIYFGTLPFFGPPTAQVQTTAASGDLLVTVPAGVGEGNVAITVWEGSTGASSLVSVRIGSTNPLWDSEIGGIPALALLLTLLILVLLAAVFLLWRRTGGAGGVRKPPMGPVEKAPPPPPPGPGHAAPATGPMSVACKHCGKTIEITTSKRPIEVMCPSCGETQLVA